MTNVLASAMPATAPRPFPMPKPSRALMSALGVVNRWCLLHGYFRIRELDLPRVDRERLRMAVNEDTAAFLAPNHPEFGLDWMMDKELSTIVAPRMASWASHEIVRSAPGFWTRNNLIANSGGDAAAEYSINWALAGHGVLLHPEGMVHWTSNTVHPLFNGVAELATEAARRSRQQGGGRRVFIAPVVWKFRYTHDVSAALDADITRIERALDLPSSAGNPIAERFRRLQESVLARQIRLFEFDDSAIRTIGFFARQEAFRDWLISDLLTRYTIEPADSIERTMHRLARVIAAHRRTAGRTNPALERDADRVMEAERLCGFSRESYGTETLSQEQIGESLKRVRASLMQHGFRSVVQNYLPMPYGPRVAHVRIPEPIPVNSMRASGDAEEREGYVRWLIEQTRTRMQQKLDAINREIDGDVQRFSHPNPFAERGVS